MHQELEKAKTLLHQQTLSLVSVRQNTVVFQYTGPGVRGLMQALADPAQPLKEAFTADRIIGKAAALLLVAGEVTAVYTPTISNEARKAFQRFSIEFYYDREIDYIHTRDMRDMCPLEKLCLSIDDPNQAREEIARFMKEMEGRVKS